MIGVVLACGMTALLLIVGIVLLAWPRVLRARLRDRVVVTLKTGDSFAGVLYAHDGKALVLRETEALGAGARSTNLPLDGELIVLLPDVAYIQKP